MVPGSLSFSCVQISPSPLWSNLRPCPVARKARSSPLHPDSVFHTAANAGAAIASTINNTTTATVKRNRPRLIALPPLLESGLLGQPLLDKKHFNYDKS